MSCRKVMAERLVFDAQRFNSRRPAVWYTPHKTPRQECIDEDRIKRSKLHPPQPGHLYEWVLTRMGRLDAYPYRN
ncbi:unnamed protein product [Protopolystoma xenopodis]|uniref:Uncharacterized protein n=1 Tax=Protopolystoma xenopodis TaxID=117903 RepID=A0A448WE22_9PLAT|nr:unnamed protein product [Protopolystoma xenopodis]